MLVPVTLSDLERLTVMIQIYPVDLCNYARTVWLKAPTLGKVTHRRGAYFYRVSHALPQGATASASPKKFDPSYIHLYGLAESDQIKCRDTRGGVCFQGISHAHQIRGCATPACRKIRDLLNGAHSVRNTNQILRGDQTGCEEIFYILDHAPCLTKMFGDTNADEPSVCGS